MMANEEELLEGHQEHCTSEENIDEEKLSIVENNTSVVIPDVSMTQLLFKSIDMNYEIIKDRVWVGDVRSGISYKFSDIKPMSRKIASALTRLGFKKGDILFFVTYETALTFMVNIGVWLCGGAVRGSYQREQKDVYLNQMRDVYARFVVCDAETSVPVKMASNQLGWNVTLLSVGGKVEGALSIEELMKDEDGSAFPRDVMISPREDALLIMNTSGSTGNPKGVIQTHYNKVAQFTVTGLVKKLDGAESSMLTTVANYFSTILTKSMSSILTGTTLYHASNLDIKMFLKALLKYKPRMIFMHPYSLHAFITLPEIENYDLTFLKVINTAGAVIHYTTAKAIESKLPHVELGMVYGTTETNLLTHTDPKSPATPAAISKYRVAGLKYKKLNGDIHLTSGRLNPKVKAKIVNPSTGRLLGRNVKGCLLVKSPYFMKGYLTGGEMKESSAFVDENGWYDTGDLAFFDEEDFLYVVDRCKNTFKYLGHWVSPTEIEAIILKHPEVVSAIVVGVPDPVITSAARAYVVLRPGSKVTEEEIKNHVTENTERYKHLHGGVVFVDSIPVTAGGKQNRPTLLKRAIEELTSCN